MNYRHFCPNKKWSHLGSTCDFVYTGEILFYNIVLQILQNIDNKTISTRNLTNEKRILRVFMIIERQIVPAYTGGEQVHQLLKMISYQFWILLFYWCRHDHVSSINLRSRNPPVINMIKPRIIIMLMTARGFRIVSFLKRNGDRAVVNVKQHGRGYVCCCRWTICRPL